MDDPFDSLSPLTDAPDIHTIQSPNLLLETSTVSNTRNNFRVASQDLDYPGSDVDSSDDLIYEDPSYDDFPQASGKIKEALLSVSEAASQKTLDAQILFGTISGILDVHCQTSDPEMSLTHVLALKDLHEELTAVARRHFEAFVKGTSAQTYTDESKDAMHTSKNNNTEERNSKLSYAQVVNHNSRATPQNAHLNNNGSSAKGDPKPNTDERHFLRLPKDDLLRELSGYALLTHLKAKLGPDGQLLSNILPTKTGFALCLSKGNSFSLGEKLAGSNLLEGKLLEKSTHWISYRVSNPTQIWHYKRKLRALHGTCYNCSVFRRNHIANWNPPYLHCPITR